MPPYDDQQRTAEYNAYLFEKVFGQAKAQARAHADANPEFNLAVGRDLLRAADGAYVPVT